jgi:tetratricopeptide (TPR) repeat protein
MAGCPAFAEEAAPQAPPTGAAPGFRSANPTLAPGQNEPKPTKSELSEGGTLSLQRLPSRYQFLLVESMQRFQLRDFKGALAYVDKADEVLPPTAWSLNIRGAIAIEMHNFELGLKHCSDALKLDPNFFPAKFNICEIPFLQGQYSEARRLWGQIYSGLGPTDSSNELIIYRIYLTYLLENNMTQAKEWLEKLPFPSQTPSYQYAHAAWARQQGDMKKWEEWLQSAAFIWPEMKRSEYVDVLIQLGWMKRD